MSTVAAIVALLFVAGVVRVARTRRFLRSAVRVRAKIVGSVDASVSNPDTGSQTAPTTRYVVELPRRDGRTRSVPLADAFGGALADRFAGADGTIAVAYDPRRPDVVRIDSPWALHFLSAFLCAPGVLFALLVAYVAIRS